MRLYDQLSQRKQRKEKLDMANLTHEMLHQLWWREDIADVAIADLYGVAKKKVTNLRHKWGIKTPETIVREFEEKFGGEVPDVEGDPQSPAVSKEGRLLIQKIYDLNDIELESLRAELAHRFAIFRDVKKEVDFLALIERAVRQFRAKGNK
ncbi:hypothetical protein NZD89_27620 [Alicyclobacillus fastidiosus]|uniref:Uncharacterized protein n=1 Tax=Alicyclobacillus fastidiosus TaxID=392011 RepID=A0ABY6ZII4_9BACL|nr:hypothetical protein [Alicyclobacillus fastidiosus]WAH41924.1 hypothetical protein NZD89_27620 [Alicyclobacillus fastidiosus]GMA63643.1 hypothetical protein GCM10025859_40830 [Alicyclobacillus fastidiosus]